MSAPPSPRPPLNSHFVRKVKLRLAYRLAFEISGNNHSSILSNFRWCLKRRPNPVTVVESCRFCDIHLSGRPVFFGGLSGPNFRFYFEDFSHSWPTLVNTSLSQHHRHCHRCTSYCIKSSDQGNLHCFEFWKVLEARF